MKKLGQPVYIIIFLVLLVSLSFVFYFGFKFYKGLKPAFVPPSQDIAQMEDESSNLGLTLPQGFSISVFAKDLAGARVMAFDRDGNLLVSQTSKGKIVFLKVKNGKVLSQKTVFSNLKNPHGLAFHPDDASLLYFAEENKISKVSINLDGNAGAPQKVIDLPSGGRHFTRTLAFSRLYLSGEPLLFVSVGSTCDVCFEKDSRNGAVMALNPDGSNARVFAKGLRNAVFIAPYPKTGEIVATEMGRDWLGDDLPPDEVNILDQEGADFGWPICFGNRIYDLKFNGLGTKEAGASFCKNTGIPLIEIPAHSAPLGLAFMDKSWGSDYENDLFVAYHGSWNKSVPTGYKVVKFKNSGGVISKTSEDFISGWLKNGEAIGRPVDIKIGPDGAMYISDDKAGVIYRVVKQ